MEAKEEEAEVATIINEDTQFAEDQEDAATVFTDAVVSNPDNDQEDAATVFTDNVTVVSNPDAATVFTDDGPPPLEVPLRFVDKSEAEPEEVWELDHDNDGDTEPPSAVVPTPPEDRKMDQMQRLLVATQNELLRVQKAHAELQMARHGCSGAGASSSSMAAPPAPSTAAPEPKSAPLSGKWPSKNPHVQLYKNTNCSLEERRKRDWKIQKEDRRKARKKKG